jgi:hypothetical protein
VGVIVYSWEERERQRELEKQKKIEWVSSLQAGDEVAYMGRGYGTSWVVSTVVKRTPSGRVNLSGGTVANPDGTIRGGYGSIQPVTEEIRRILWRRMAIQKVHRELKIDKLSDNNLNRILQIMKEHEEEEKRGIN